MSRWSFFNFKNWILCSGQTVHRIWVHKGFKEASWQGLSPKKIFLKIGRRCLLRIFWKTDFWNVKIFSFSKNPQKATLSEINENRLASSPGPNGSESTSSKKTPALTKFVVHVKVGSSEAIFAFFGIFWRFLHIFSAVYWRILWVKIFLDSPGPDGLVDIGHLKIGPYLPILLRIL